MELVVKTSLVFVFVSLEKVVDHFLCAMVYYKRLEKLLPLQNYITTKKFIQRVCERKRKI